MWSRVHDLPDFVYFDHSIHVSRGIACVKCHGRVDQMPLMRKAETLQMEWCLNCHRDPARYLRPRDQVFNMLYTPPADQLELGRRLVKEYDVAGPEPLGPFVVTTGTPVSGNRFNRTSVALAATTYTPSETCT